MDKPFDRYFSKEDKSQMLQHTPLIPALGSQRQVDFCSLKGSLGYIRKPCLKRKREGKGREGEGMEEGRKGRREEPIRA